MLKRESRKAVRKRKHLRVRKKISGSATCPRMSVYRSLKHIYAQLIDDTNGVTLVSASSVEPALSGQLKSYGNIDAAKLVGRLIAEKAQAKGIKKVVFDRGGCVYHGRIAALAEAAREAGLEF